MANMTDYGSIPIDILDDLSSRFIINIPEEERTDPIRLFFQIEQAHWFYIDFHRAENPNLKSCGMKEFAKHILKHIPIYVHILLSFDEYFEKWKDYKMSVPTFGAIVLNKDMTKVLLVQSYFEKTSWGFPKGKVNENEGPVKCATREVLEETGFDISNLIKADEFIEAVVCEQTIRLYVIRGVKETEKFHPKTRNEIKNVEWFTINDLPMNKKDVTPKLGVRPKSFFMVLPFVKRIKNWILAKRAEELKQPVNRSRMRHKSVGDITLSSPSPNSKVPRNKQQLISSGAEIMEAEFENLRHGSNLTSNSRSSKNGKQFKIESQVFRRSLFNDGSHRHIEQSSIKPNCVKMSSSKEIPPIIIQRWLNFKLDREPLLKCFDI